MPLPAVALMHPTLIHRPVHHEGWIYEEKVDGWRMVATKAEGAVRLVGRNGLDHTKRFPELVKALSALKPATSTLDGEVAVYDEELVSHFEWLRHLNHGPAPRRRCSWSSICSSSERTTTGPNRCACGGRRSRSS